MKPNIYIIATCALLLALVNHTFAQDAVPFDVAGKLWASGVPDSIYVVKDSELVFSEQFKDLSCTVDDCDKKITMFVSPPLALPFSALISITGYGVFIFRLLGVMSLAWAATIIYNKFEEFDIKLTALFISLIPAAMLSLEKGQNALLLPAIIAAGIISSNGIAGFLLAIITLTKVTPVICLIPLILYKRWNDIITFSLVMIASFIALLLHPVQGVSFFDWYEVAKVFSEMQKHNPNNAALPAPFRHIVIVTVFALLANAYHKVSFQNAWLLTWAAWPIVIPLNWGYYGWAQVTVFLLLMCPKNLLHAAICISPFIIKGFLHFELVAVYTAWCIFSFYYINYYMLKLKE